MEIPQDDTFREERKRFRLHWNCEDCCRFDSEKQSCAHGFPTDRHRRSRYENPEASILFCKEFDIA